jgi:hypothetical protein
VRAPQLVVRCLWLWIRDGRGLSGITANRGLARPQQTPKGFRQKGFRQKSFRQKSFRQKPFGQSRWHKAF